MPTAYDEFTNSLSIAEELLKIERGYSNPPKPFEQKAVQGLRGSVAVLVVASFERFLRDVIEEHLSILTTHPSADVSAMPDGIRVWHTFKTLDRAIKGPPFQKSPPKKDRLTDIEAACKKVISNVINPDAFTDTLGNPNSERVKEMMKNLDLSNIFSLINVRFVRKWRKPIAHTFIEDKLDEIVNRRHIVAHGAMALAITRAQLRESVRFMKILAQVLDVEIRNKVNKLK